MSFDTLAGYGVAIGPLAAVSRHIDSMSPADAGAYLRALEDAGVSMFWHGEVGGHEAFTFAQRLLYSCDRMVIGTGVARALDRPPKNAAAAQFTIMEEFRGRYVAGFGASADTRQRGQSTPAFLREYLAEVDVDVARLTGATARFPRILGAHSEGTTRVARDMCDGLLSFLVTPEHTKWARSVIGPGHFLSVNQWVVPGESRSRARDLARQSMQYYLQRPYQINKLRRLGFSAADLEPPGSDRLMDQLVPGGDVEMIVERLREHLASGADQVSVMLLGATPSQEASMLGELSRSLRSQVRASGPLACPAGRTHD